MKDLVTLVIPVYNIEKYISQCIESVIKQTYRNLQIIVVDDGSKDSSAGIILAYQETDNRIIYLKKENGGLSDARNYAYPYIQGDYVIFVDGDDYLEYNAVELLIESAMHNNADIVECAYYQDFSSYKKLKSVSKYEGNDFLAFGCYAVWNKMYSANLLKKSGVLFLKGINYEDINFNAKILPYVKSKTYIDVPLYNYVQRNNSICHVYDEKIKMIYTSLTDIKHFYEKNGFMSKYADGVEYLFIRELYGGTFFRTRKIQEKKLRKEILKETQQFLSENFPNYMENNYLKKKSYKLNFLLNIMKHKIVYMLLGKL